MLDATAINAIFRRYFGRDADPDGVAYFQTFDTSTEVERVILGSDEFRKCDTIIRQPSMHSAWKICILEEAKVIFVPIAKNAHTAIMSAFMAYNGIDRTTLPIIDKTVNEYGNSDDKIHAALSENNTELLFKDHSPQYVDEIMKDDEYIRLAVFRDPVDRIISVYNHFFLQEGSNPVALRHTQKVFESIGFVPGESRVEQQLDVWLRRLIKYIARTNTSELDPHWIPQYTYVSGLKIDHILPIERLDVLEQIVTARGGKKLTIDRHNVRGKGRQDGEQTVSSELRGLIEEIYWLDRRLYETAREEVDAICANYAAN